MVMSINAILMIIMMMTITIGVKSNSWMVIWFMLELNTLSFCSMKENKNEMKIKNNKIKYFIVQSISSSILVTSMFMEKMTEMKSLCYPLALTALIMKLGSVPLHSWYLNMIKTSSWKFMVLLMTTQKIFSTYLVSFMKKTLVTFFVILAIIMSTLMQMNKMNFLEILAISSLFNMGWMIISSITNMQTLALFMLLYMISVLQILIMTKNELYTNNKNMNKSNLSKFLTTTNLTNLAGLPPSSGFLSKWVVSTEMISKKETLTMTFMLILSSMNMYMYLRTFTQPIMKMTENKQQKMKTPTKMKASTVLNISVLPMFMTML